MVCASVRVLIVVGRDDLGAPNHVPNQSSFCYVKGRGRRFQNPFLFPCRKKKRFLESKEKGAPVRVEWSQIGIRRPGFTPPLRTSTVYGRLPRWNRGKLWSYPHFFRHLRRRASERGGAAWYYHCCDAASFDGHRRRYEVSRRCRWRSNRRLGGTSNRGAAAPLCLVVSRGVGVGKGGNRNPPFPTDSFAPFWSFRKGPAGGRNPIRKRETWRGLVCWGVAPRSAGPLRRQPRTICLSFTRSGAPARSSMPPRRQG